MKKERLFYLDFVRALATVVIVLTHYNALFLYNTATPMPEKAVLTTKVANVYIGSFGVSLFLIISGAALMYVYEEKCEILTFYKKRFLNIFPMFWMAYFIAFLYNFYFSKGINHSIPKMNIIYSFLGIDTYLANFSVPTFALVGEWFLGLIMVIYVIFPLLRKMVNEHPVILAAVVMILYFVSIFTVQREITLFARLPEFLFGMYFVKYIKNVNWKWAGIAILVLAYNIFLKPTFSSVLQCTYVGIFSFLLLVYISKYVKWNGMKNICSIICKYSYPCFIVHHFVIYQVVARFDLNTISTGYSYLLFLVCCCVIAVTSYLLYQLDCKIRNILK